jgi:hypothetical protein
MKFIVLASLFVLSVFAEPEAEAEAQHLTKGYVQHPNGALVPEDTDSVKVAKAQHLALKTADPQKPIVYAQGPNLYVPTKNVQVQTPMVFGAQPIHKFQVQTPLTYGIHKVQAHTYPINPFYQVYQPQVYTHAYPAVHHFRGKREAEAEAEPEADAQYYSTYNTFSRFTPYTGQYQSYGYTGYPYSSIYNNFYNRRVFKREAEAEPEADAQYYRVFNTFSGYTPYTGQYQTYGYTGYPYSSIYNNFYNRHVFKREAEAEPEADAQYMSYYNNYRVTPYSSGYQTYGYSGYPYTAGYTYNNFYNRHVFKREAEAEPEADAQYMNYYNNGYYGNYQSGFRYPYTSYVNTPYIYNNFNGYYHY